MRERNVGSEVMNVFGIGIGGAVVAIVAVWIMWAATPWN
jgi:hypothetical protein